MFKYNNKNYWKVKYSYFKLERQFNLIDANILYMLKFYHIKLLALLFWKFYLIFLYFWNFFKKTKIYYFLLNKLIMLINNK